MMFQTHLAFSLFIGLFLMERFSNKYLFLGLLLFGSLLPDLDTPYSKLGRKIKPISGLIKFLFGHRKLFHSLLIAVLIFVIFNYILDMYLVGAALFSGFVLHLVMDGLTREGINFLYPFAKFRVSGFVKTRGFFDWLLLFVFIFLIGLKVVL